MMDEEVEYGWLDGSLVATIEATMSASIINKKA